MNRGIHTDEKAGVELDTRSVELPTGVTLQYVEQGDPSGVPVLLLPGGFDSWRSYERVLHALTSCLAVGFVYNAAAQDVEVEALGFELEGEIDLHGFLGLSDDVRPGYKGLELTYRVETDAPKEKVVELCEYVQRTSPVLDLLRNLVPVSVRLEEVGTKA